MLEQSATLQMNNERLVNYLETLKAQRKELDECIGEAIKERKTIEDEVNKLKAKLQEIDDDIVKKSFQLDSCNVTIIEAELGLVKIVESSEYLVKLVRQETQILEEGTSAN